MFQARDLERISKNVVAIIDDELSRVGLFFRIFSRIKTNDSISKKIQSKGYDGISKSLQDIIGIRVILYFTDDLSVVSSFLKSSFGLVSETIDKNEETRFAPTRINLIFRLPFGMDKELSDLTQNRIIDTTFEVQLRTILSEGWHEVDHDLRYKCSDDWKENIDLSRSFNGILASIETSEFAILRLFDQLSHRHYKANEIVPMIRTKFRLRFLNDNLSEELDRVLSKSLVRDLFKLDRIDVLNLLVKCKYLVPLTIENLIYILNFYLMKNESLLNITPGGIISELEQNVFNVAIEEE